MSGHLEDDERGADVAPDSEEVGELHRRLITALIHIRDLNGLRNKHIAERLKITESYISQLLRGKRDVRLSMLNRIAKEFGIEASELLSDKWDETEKKTPETSTPPPDLNQLLALVEENEKLRRQFADSLRQENSEFKKKLGLQ